MTRIENWSVQVHFAQYREPKVTGSTLYLCGNVYGHGQIINGRRIKTPRINTIDLKSRLINTEGGAFRLGRPDSWYIAWLKEQNFPINDLGGYAL